MGIVGRWLCSGAFALAVVDPAIAQEQQHRDAVPQAVPEGYEPVDVSEEVRQIEQRQHRELELQADRDVSGRYETPERRLRARYGGATWNLYEPYE